MATVDAFTARRIFAQLLRRAQCGEEIVITRRGKAVARLVPVVADAGAAAAMATFRRLRERARRSGLGKLDWRAYRDQGRP